MTSSLGSRQPRSSLPSGQLALPSQTNSKGSIDPSPHVDEGQLARSSRRFEQSKKPLQTALRSMTWPSPQANESQSSSSDPSRQSFLPSQDVVDETGPAAPPAAAHSRPCCPAHSAAHSAS